MLFSPTHLTGNLSETFLGRAPWVWRFSESAQLDTVATIKYVFSLFPRNTANKAQHKSIQTYRVRTVNDLPLVSGTWQNVLTSFPTVR